jgi:hypothetical protein
LEEEVIEGEKLNERRWPERTKEEVRKLKRNRIEEMNGHLQKEKRIDQIKRIERILRFSQIRQIGDEMAAST